MLPSVNEMKDDPPAFNTLLYGKTYQNGQRLVPDLHHRVPALLMQIYSTRKKAFPEKHVAYQYLIATKIGKGKIT